MSKIKGFTLIELLVVISIISVLASVVLAALSSARNQGKQAVIKSELRDMINQAELVLGANNPNSYAGVCTALTSTMAAINKTGATSACYSYNWPALSDLNLRWGATGIIYNATPPVKAWSSSSNLGVVTWDAQGVNSSGVFVGTDVNMTWYQANTACTTAGGRLPTTEELKTLSDATYIASGNVTRAPPGFIALTYWSGTTVPGYGGIYAYINDMTIATGGGVGNDSKTSSLYYVRCVR